MPSLRPKTKTSQLARREDHLLTIIIEPRNITLVRVPGYSFIAFVIGGIGIRREQRTLLCLFSPAERFAWGTVKAQIEASLGIGSLC